MATAAQPPAWANEREQDALLRARRRYTREGLKADDA